MPKQFPPHLPGQPSRTHHVFRWSILVLVLILFILLGVLIGWVLRNRFTNVQIIERATPVFVAQDAASQIARMDRAVLRSVLPVMVGKGTGVIKGVTSSIFTAHDQAGYAVAVTTDGWIVSTRDVVKGTAAQVVVEGRLYPIEKVVADPYTPLVFAKLKNATLVPVTLARPEEQLTEAAAVPAGSGMLRAVIVDSVSVSSCDCVVHDARQYQEAGQASPFVAGVALGHPIFSSSGQVIGIVSALDATNRVLRFVPSSLIASVLPELFTTSVIARPQIPMSYVTLSEVTIADTVPSPQQSGVRVVSVLKSASMKVPLREGDILTAVAGKPITPTQSLTQLLFATHVGTVIPLQVTRNGKEMTIDITLDSQ